MDGRTGQRDRDADHGVRGRPASTSHPAVARDGPPRRDAWAAGSLFVLTLLAYAGGLDNGWVHWDDTLYVRNNPDVRLPGGLRRIWTGFESEQYYPLTFTSYWLEYRLWGDRPTGYYVTNVLLHAINALLVHRIALRLGAGRLAAWVAAALFALHPIQTASVAWLAERKNTLSGALGLLAFLLYLRHGTSRRRVDYAAALAAFVGALLAKTAVLTLPVSMLLAERVLRGPRARDGLLRVLPMLAAGGVLGLITMVVEEPVARAQLSPALRPLAAAGAVWFYLGKLVLPVRMAAIYPPWEVSAAAVHYWLALAGVAAIGWVLWRWRAALGPLILWSAGHYVLLLLPVLGLLRFDYLRHTPVADHFVYLAVIGPFLAAATGFARLAGSARRAAGARITAGAVACLVLAALVLRTRQRVEVWHDGVRLWSETLAINPRNADAHNNLGVSLLECGRENDALEHFRAAVRIDPLDFHSRTNLGNLLRSQGRLDEAVEEFRRAWSLAPTNAAVNFNLAITLAQRGDFDEAIGRYEEALRLDPDYAEAHTNLGIALRAVGRTDEAVARLRQALRLNPRDAVAHFNLGVLLGEQGLLDEAAEHYRRCAQLAPRDPLPWTNLGLIHLARGDGPRAAESFLEALRRDANDGLAHLNYGAWLAQQGHARQAEQHLRAAVRLRPADAEAHANLGALLAQTGRAAEAVERLARALELRPDYANAHFMRGVALASLGRHEEAADAYEQALRLQPADAEAHYRRGMALESAGRAADAVTAYRRAVELRPQWPEPALALVWLLAAADDDDVRNPSEAVLLARELVAGSGQRDARAFDALAAASAAAGAFEEAVDAALRAAGLARDAGDETTAAQIEQRAESYRSRLPPQLPPR